GSDSRGGPSGGGEAGRRGPLADGPATVGDRRPGGPGGHTGGPAQARRGPGTSGTPTDRTGPPADPRRPDGGGRPTRHAPQPAGPADEGPGSWRGGVTRTDGGTQGGSEGGRHSFPLGTGFRSCALPTGSESCRHALWRPPPSLPLRAPAPLGRLW